jgi:WD40 repeat protein
MADVFISYARKDGGAFAEELAEALKARGKDVWLDRRDIPLAANWREEARTGIEQSNSVVYVITRDSVDSENCLYELAHAEAYSKRIIPVRKDPLEPDELPSSVAPLIWVDFSDGTGDAFDELEQTIDRDPEWVAGHTRWLGEALDWDRNRRDRSYLPTGAELNEAEAWLTQAQAGRKEPPATPLHYEFILAGRRLATRRQRGFILAVTTALGVALALGANWFLQRNEAREQRRVAISRLLANEAESALERSLDTGLLLGVAAYEVEPTPEARDSLLNGLRRSEHIRAFLHEQDVAVSAVSFDPTSRGQALVGGARDGRVWIWSVPERKARPHGGHLRPVKAVGVSADGRLFASVDDDGHTLVRLLAAPRQIVGKASGVTALAFAPRGATLALGLAAGTVALWDREGGTRLCRKVEGVPITALAFDESGTTLVAGSRRGLAALRLGEDLACGRAIRFGRGSSVVDVALDGDRVAAVRDDGGVVVWTLAAGDPTARPLEAPDDAVSVAIGPESELVTGNADGSITFWDREWDTPQARVRGHGGDVTDLAFDGDGRTLASTTADETIVVWDLEATPFHDRIPIAAGQLPLDRLVDLAFVPPGRTLAASALDQNLAGRVIVADAANASTQDLGLAPGSSVDIDVSPDGAWLAAAGQQGLALWRLGERPKRERPGRAGRSPATAVAFSDDGKELALGLQDGSIRLWDVPVRDEGRLLGDRQETVAALAFDPPLLASGGEKGALTLWNVSDRTSAELPERLDEIRAVAFSPGRRLVAYGGGDAVVVWDVESGSVYATPELDVGEIADVAFSPPTGRWLAVGGESGSVVLWDVVERRRVGETLEAAEGNIVALDFRPDGSALAAAVSTAAVVLWDDVLWSADEARRRVCDLVRRGLLEDERNEFVPRGTDVDPCPAPGS